MLQVGWLCPRCKKVNAPWVSQCSCENNLKININEPWADSFNEDSFNKEYESFWGTKAETNKT